MSSRRAFGMFLICSLLTISTLGAQQATLSGRVFDSRSGHGVAALTIRLEAPKAEGGRQIITSTDSDGRFTLPNLSLGRYLFTVSQGGTPLYRDVVVINADTTKNVPLQPG